MSEFWILGVILVASAVWVVSAKKAVYSVIGLLLHFFALSILYLSLSAEFLAIVQIVVYGGAILILFVFVIALLSSGVAAFSIGPDRLPKITVPAGLVALAGLGFLTYGVAKSPHIIAPAASLSGSVLGVAGQANVLGSVADFGKALFTTNLLPFEITAFILMVAVIGVVVLAEESPYPPGRSQSRKVEKQMREAIVRAGES